MKDDMKTLPTPPLSNRQAQLEGLLRLCQEWARDYVGLEPGITTRHGRLVAATRALARQAPAPAEGARREAAGG